MISLQTRGHIGPDGTLSVEVPTPLRETNVDVMLVLQPIPVAPTSEELGWPTGFFEATAGAWAGEPLERGPQGDYEVREVIK